MITDRIRKKKVSAAGMLNIIERMQGDKKYDSETLEVIAKHITGKAFISDDFEPGTNIVYDYEVNEPFEVAEMLRKLNRTIDFLNDLGDNYYREYIFNASTIATEELERLGFNEEWALETANKLEKVRSILYGDSVNWEEIEVLMMRKAAYALREDNERLKDRNRKLEYDAREKK